MTTRKYSSRSQQTTLTGALTSSATSATVVSGSGLLGGVTVSAGETFTVVIDPDTAVEEIVEVTAVSSNTLTIVRGIDGSTGQAHSAGAVVRHMAIGRDYREANTHIEASTAVHGITGAVVGTTDTQTLTNKTLTSPTVSSLTLSDASIVFEGATADAYETTLTVTDPTADRTITLPNATTTLVGTDTTQTLTNKTIDSASNTLTGVVTLTGTQTLTNKTLTSPTITGTGTIAGTFTGNLTGNVTGTVSGNAGTVTNGVYTTDTGTVTSTMIADGTIVNADINSSAQIAYSKTNLTNSIVDADINASAAIAWSKIAPSSTISTTELGYLDGVTSAIQTQIDSKLATSTAASTYAPLASPALTGTPTAPTAAANTNTTQIATTAYVQTEIADLIAAAPGALDTLNELAAALGNDASFSTTVTNSLATKLPLAGGTMSGAIAMGTNKITGLGDPTNAQDAATKNYIDTAVLAPSNLTGPITSVGNATSIASQTGTGTKFVMDNSPTLITPVLGVATATSINGTTIPSSKTLVATDSTAYVVPSQTGNSGKVLTTDGTTSSWSTTINNTAIPASKTLVVTTDKLSALAATSSSELAGIISDETGSGSLVFGTSPTITPAAGTTSTATTGAGYLGLPQNSTTTGAYTVVAADAGKHIYSTATRTITIDSNANLALPVGTTITFISGSGATTTIAITTDTMYLAGAGTTGSRTLAAYGMATAIKIASTTWIISGNGLT